MKRTALFYAVPAALILGGLFAFAGILQANLSASRYDRWTQARGTIQSVEGTAITYRYEAGGQMHQQRATVSKLLKSHVPGGRVLVYVNPAEPSQSVIERLRRPPQWPIVAATTAIVMGLAVGLASLRRGPGGAARPRSRRKPIRKPAPPLSRLRPPVDARRKQGD